MQWESWSAFWDMGGAAFYVWGSYGLTFALIALELVLVFQRRKDTTRRLLRCHPWSPGGVDHVPLADPVTGRPIPGTTGPRDIGSHSAADLRTSDTEATANAAPRHPSHTH